MPALAPSSLNTLVTSLMLTKWNQISVHPPSDSVMNNPNITLHFEIDQIKMKALRGQDVISLGTYGSINGDRRHNSMNYTPPTSRQRIDLHRNVHFLTELKNQKLMTMPGFKLTWYYSGMDVESKPHYYQNPPNPYNPTNAFIRNDSIKIFCNVHWGYKLLIIHWQSKFALCSKVKVYNILPFF